MGRLVLVVGISSTPRRNKHLWRCYGKLKNPKTRKSVRCKFTASRHKGTWLDNTWITAVTTILFVSVFLSNALTTIYARENLGMLFTSFEDWCNYVREVCREDLRTQEVGESIPKIGGGGFTVEVDETLLGRRKSCVSRSLMRQWVLGGIERGSRKVFLTVIPNRTADTLTQHIRRNIAPGTTIITDCWKGYGFLRHNARACSRFDHRDGSRLWQHFRTLSGLNYKPRTMVRDNQGNLLLSREEEAKVFKQSLQVTLANIKDPFYDVGHKQTSESHVLYLPPQPASPSYDDPIMSPTTILEIEDAIQTAKDGALGSHLFEGEGKKRIEHAFGTPLTINIGKQNINTTPRTKTAPRDPTFTAVIKGIPLDIAEEEVEQELQETGIKFNRCRRIISRATNSPTSFFRIISSHQPSIAKLLRAVECRAPQQCCANCGSTSHPTTDWTCPRRPAAPNSQATTISLQVSPAPEQQDEPKDPGDNLVTVKQLLTLLSIVLANTHPQERSTVAQILNRAAEAVLDTHITLSYSNNTITLIITYSSLFH
ncbi:hypothetical protein J437_LFUL016620 [Ladona fulva]|uniref:ISXO2-like transposase domain-containing protein n=1 Tax=Ladona fulva TaxID=123851 RepID=A0A8K0KJJ9_LADFU|nr:hypothetical protein J437_LFUL016620 [Ladona fulva]